jgi:nucleotide-binding universal stress UspA family protein
MAVDGSPSSTAVVRWGVRQAQALGARPVAVMAWPPAQRSDIASEPDARRAVRDVLDRGLDPDSAAAVRVDLRPSGRFGDAVEALVRETDAADILVLGRRDGRRHDALGRTIARVIEHADCPVAVVRPSDEHRDTRRILVGVDGSARAHAALSWAMRYAGTTGAALTALIAWEWVAQYPLLPYAIEQETQSRQAAERLERAIAACSSQARSSDAPSIDPSKIERRVVEGPAGEVLLVHAHDADMLVVGATGVGRVRGRLLGSVSQHAARFASEPVVVVRSDLA